MLTLCSGKSLKIKYEVYFDKQNVAFKDRNVSHFLLYKFSSSVHKVVQYIFNIPVCLFS